MITDNYSNYLVDENGENDGSNATTLVVVNDNGQTVSINSIRSI